MIFCLVRTDTTKKHEGISFVVFSMRQPGVEVRPIRLIAGNSPFCETFITDVKVPKDDLVGPLNGGWSVAKRQLQHERSGMEQVLAAVPGRRWSSARSPRPMWARTIRVAWPIRTFGRGSS